jgi:hypothetical protein
VVFAGHLETVATAFGERRVETNSRSGESRLSRGCLCRGVSLWIVCRSDDGRSWSWCPEVAGWMSGRAFRCCGCSFLDDWTRGQTMTQLLHTPRPRDPGPYPTPTPTTSTSTTPPFQPITPAPDSPSSDLSPLRRPLHLRGCRHLHHPLDMPCLRRATGGAQLPPW